MAIFSSVQSLRPGRSVFNLSHEKKFTGDMGLLYPVLCDEVVPGDTWHIGNEIVIRFQPLVAPILHEVNCYVHYFFVPYRLLWTSWEDFITGGADGQQAPTLPRWTPGSTVVGSLWDHLGFPIGISPTGALPMQFPLNAYNLIYNNYYRDEQLVTAVALTDETVKRRAWEKDYFTSSLPWQQRGTAPALPLSGYGQAFWTDATFVNPGGGINVQVSNTGSDTHLYANDAVGRVNLKNAMNANSVNFASAATFNVSDLRLAFQIQKWMERNARAGARYTEFLGAHFGVAPRDERLQRPEYIGGSKSPVIVSEVLQTSASNAQPTPQGNLAGHGITASKNDCARYTATEFGLIMGIMSIMPRTAYSQGINRQWLRTTKYDFYFPEFAHLSEQAVLRAELYADGVSGDNNTIFGYQGRYDEMRFKPSILAGKMKYNQTFNYWHLGREFASAPALNQTFIECNPSKRCFAVQNDDVLMINIANMIKAIRPLPIEGAPGLIDHS